MRISDWSSDVCSSDLLYVVVTAVSIPGAAVLTLAAGALFGLVTGTVLVSFASTLGATLAFLSARFVLRDSLEARYGERLQNINAGVKRDGGFYLFTLRVVPVFPFFVIRSEEHTSELQSLMRNSYAVFCLKKKI